MITDRTELLNKWCLCNHCIDAIKSRGEKLFVGDMVLDYEESEELNFPCEWCGEFGELYEVM